MADKKNAAKGSPPVSDPDEKEDCTCYAKSRSPQACSIPKNVTHPLRYYEFTQEEIRALEECDRESFYQRCIPFSTLFASLTYAAIKFGLLNRNPHFGSVPKILTAALLGHIYGRLSYIQECDQKIRELPENSHLGKVMRQYYQEKYPPPPKK